MEELYHRHAAELRRAWLLGTARRLLLAQERKDWRRAAAELIWLTEWEQLQITEAALVLGMRPGTARMRLHRARRSLAAHPALRKALESPRTGDCEPGEPDGERCEESLVLERAFE